MARPRKPTNLKVLAGGRVRDDKDAAKQEATPDVSLPPCPAWLKGKARKHWNTIGSELVSLGLLTSIDGDIFAAYIDTNQRYVEANKALESVSDWIDETPNGFMIQSVMMQLRNSLQKQLVSLGREFGMTPSARSGIKVDTKQPSLFGNDFQEFGT